MLAFNLKTILATFILLVGVVDDLRSQKVHNRVILILAAIAVLSLTFLEGFVGLTVGAGSLFTAFIMTLPFFMMKILGGGDVKLFLVFAILVDWKTTITTLVFSFFWGALLGVFQVVLKGEFFSVLKNCYGVITRVYKPQTAVTLHKIPYTVALLFGWFSNLVLLEKGVSLL